MPSPTAVVIDQIDGDRAAEEGVGGTVHTNFDKLSRQHRREFFVRRQLEQDILVVEMLKGNDPKVYNVFLHLCVIVFLMQR